MFDCLRMLHVKLLSGASRGFGLCMFENEFFQIRVVTNEASDEVGMQLRQYV
jgi:hypothetical protein